MAAAFAAPAGARLSLILIKFLNGQNQLRGCESFLTAIIATEFRSGIVC
jgi:hypothetical protein